MQLLKKKETAAVIPPPTPPQIKQREDVVIQPKRLKDESPKISHRGNTTTEIASRQGTA